MVPVSVHMLEVYQFFVGFLVSAEQVFQFLVRVLFVVAVGADLVGVFGHPSLMRIVTVVVEHPKLTSFVAEVPDYAKLLEVFGHPSLMRIVTVVVEYSKLTSFVTKMAEHPKLLRAFGRPLLVSDLADFVQLISQLVGFFLVAGVARQVVFLL